MRLRLVACCCWARTQHKLAGPVASTVFTVESFIDGVRPPGVAPLPPRLPATAATATVGSEGWRNGGDWATVVADALADAGDVAQLPTVHVDELLLEPPPQSPQHDPLYDEL